MLVFVRVVVCYIGVGTSYSSLVKIMAWGTESNAIHALPIAPHSGSCGLDMKNLRRGSIFSLWPHI